MSNDCTDSYLSVGKRLTLLNGKIPILKGWVHRDVSAKIIKGHRGNIGWVMGEDDLVVDVDPRNGGDLSYDNLVKYLNLTGDDLPRTVSTPSGGFHVYLKIHEDYVNLKLRKVVPQFKGIEFLSLGAQCGVAGNVGENGVHYEFVTNGFAQGPAPIGLLNLLRRGVNVSDPDNVSLDAFDGLLPHVSGYDADGIRLMLAKLDPSMGNDEWVTIGMALHDWHAVDGYELWEEWSKGGTNYTEGDTASRWGSFHNTANGVSIGTLVYKVKLAKFDNEATVVDKVLSDILSNDDRGLQFKVIPDIKKLQLSDINRERIAVCLQKRLSVLTDIKVPIKTSRDLISPDVGVLDYSDSTKLDEAPQWCKDWVYVNAFSGFVSKRTRMVHKQESFNFEHGKDVPLGVGGAKVSAFKYVSENGFVEKVDVCHYLPNSEAVFSMIDGVRVMNSYNPRTRPLPAQSYTEGGVKAVEILMYHLNMICGRESYASILTQWLAHNVQYPGKKLQWAPVIQGIEGVGKTFFAELLRACLGHTNVGTVSPEQAVSVFNSWAANVCVNILEELKIAGKNRHEAVNALKPLITDNTIQINAKLIPQYQTKNTTNYMCLTNHRDCLPLTITDRRWWIIFVQIFSLSQIKEITGMDPSVYFHQLYSSMREYTAEVHKWLLEYPISDEFKMMKTAPMTDFKKSMVVTEEASFEGLSEVRSMIKEGGKYFNNVVVSAHHLFLAFAHEYPDIYPNNGRKVALLKKLGYSKLAKRINIEGHQRSVWSRKQLDIADVRKAFDVDILK